MHQGLELAGGAPASLRIAARLRAVALVVLCGFLAAATYRATLNVLSWRGSSELARTIAQDATYSEQDRVNACVAMFRDACASIDEMQRLARIDSVIGKHARNLLDDLAEASRR